MQDQRTVPPGTCHCGCGETPEIAPQSSSSKGWVKGQPKRYVFGHHARGRKNVRRLSDVDYVIDPVTGCWVWQLAVNGRGYGQARVEGRRDRQFPAHRVMYERHRGPIPAGLVIDHLCRNRRCVNPAHLEPVTGIENIRRGINVKLTLEQAREIKYSDASGRYLAKRFGIAEQTVCGIRKGRAWKDA
jgi:hypothetical protein